MTIFDYLGWKLLYLAVLAAVICAEHVAFAARWKRHELARRTLGIATVMVGAFPLAAAGLIDAATWLWLFAAFGVAGAVTAGLYTLRAAESHGRRVSDLRGRFGQDQ